MPPHSWLSAPRWNKSSRAGKNVLPWLVGHFRWVVVTADYPRGEALSRSLARRLCGCMGITRITYLKAGSEQRRSSRYGFIATRAYFLSRQGSKRQHTYSASRCTHGVFPYGEFSRHWLPVSVAGIIVAITGLTGRQGCN